jgi:hypothetical protein
MWAEPQCELRGTLLSPTVAPLVSGPHIMNHPGPSRLGRVARMRVFDRKGRAQA